MSSYQFINLHPLIPGEEERLAILKREFNKMATTYNTAWPKLSTEERDEMISKLSVLEWDILDQMSRNKPHTKE